MGRPMSSVNYPPEEEEEELDLRTEYCERCGVVLTMPAAEYVGFMVQHRKFCTSVKTELQPDLTANISSMSKLKLQKGEDFYFMKVPLDEEGIRFRWKKEPLFQVRQEVLRATSAELAQLRFEEKFACLRYHLEKRRVPWTAGAQILKVDKENVVLSSLGQLQKLNLYKELKIEFMKDKVNDAGGLLREWMHLCVKEFFQRGDLGIFVKADTEELCYRINPDLELCLQFSIQLFEFIGLLFGKALFERINLDCYLDRPFLRHLLGQHVLLADVFSFDRQFYRGWKYLLECEPEQIVAMEQEFVAAQRCGESYSYVRLDEAHQYLTPANRKHFVQRSIQFYTLQAVQHQVAAFKKGFHKVVPEELIRVFKPEQMEMMLYGVPFVNVNDLRSHTVYKGVYNDKHRNVQWFWKFIQGLEQSQLRRFLQFLTGSERPPVFGFARLQSNRNNISYFCIQSVEFDRRNPYPKAHTCFNRLELPLYHNEKQQLEMLRAVVENNLEGVYGLD